MLTGYQLTQMMEHAVGSRTDPRNDIWACLNRAGHRLVSIFDWPWRQVGPVTLTFPSGQRFVDMPADFGQCVAISLEAQPAYTVETCSAKQIMEFYRVSNNITGTTQFVAFDAPNPQNVNLNRAYTYPQPQSDRTYVLLYKKRWKPLSSTFPDETPNIPDFFEKALLSSCRCEALKIEEPESGRWQVEDADFLAECDRLKSEQGMHQINYGRLRGGANDNRGALPWYKQYPVNVTFS